MSSPSPRLLTSNFVGYFQNSIEDRILLENTLTVYVGVRGRYISPQLYTTLHYTTLHYTTVAVASYGRGGWHVLKVHTTSECRDTLLTNLLGVLHDAEVERSWYCTVQYSTVVIPPNVDVYYGQGQYQSQYPYRKSDPPY